MRIGGAFFIGTLLTGLMVTSASATVRISGDYGGQIGHYLDRFQAVKNSGDQVMIDGLCLSACTLVLGVVPRDHICVTSRAKLGFHAAWRPGESTRQETSANGTKLLMDTYPQPVRSWIAQRGGLSPQVMYLSGRELAAMYKPCK